MKHSHCETVYAKELFQWLYFELVYSLRIFSILPTFKLSGLTKECQWCTSCYMMYTKSSIWSGFETKNWIEDQFQSSPKLVGIWTVLRCIFVPNLEIVTPIDQVLASEKGRYICMYSTTNWMNTSIERAWLSLPLIYLDCSSSVSPRSMISMSKLEFEA